MHARMLATARAEEHRKVIDAPIDENEGTEQPARCVRNAGEDRICGFSKCPGEPVVPRAPQVPRNWRD
jgi:hypothetical protein